MIMKVKQNDTQCKTTGNNIGKIGTVANIRGLFL